MDGKVVLDREDALMGEPELHRLQREDVPIAGGHRSLGSNDHNDFQSYLVDKNGNQYDPYSLAWRYVGLYIDCSGDDDEHHSNDHRRLHERNGGECQRRLLWAAYVDRRHRGNGIEEYQFYDLETSEWDDSACLASGKRHRCVRLNCHESSSHFKLVGVFKETDGLYDWHEQLFKHEGVCVWNDDDSYETMETWMERWPNECTKLNMPDYDGNSLYIAVQPLAEGNMTLGIYTDNQCTTISPWIDLETYIVRLYRNYYYSDEKGYKVAEMYKEAINTWNEKMTSFKICQPCRAYNLHEAQTDRHGHRLLGGEDNDGDGEEQERYNCKCLLIQWFLHRTCLSQLSKPSPP